MKCPYCSEEIQDTARLCRYCGAQRSGESWSAPTRAKGAPRGNFTIVSSGWLLLLSGALSLLDLGAPLSFLPGANVWVVRVYNGSLTLLLCAMGAALIRRSPRALQVTLAASVLYTVDKLGLLLLEPGEGAFADELGDSLGEFAPLVQQLTRGVALLFLLGWWSFVLYLFYRRDYFRPRAAS